MKQPISPITPAALEAAFSALGACDRGRKVIAQLAPAIRTAVYLDVHYRDALLVLFQALQQNQQNGTLVDRTVGAAEELGLPTR